MTDDFDAVWNRHYPAFHPVGWMMRYDGARHWLRFHSLPEGRRYAETAEQRQVLLERQNRVAGEVLGEDCVCWLAQSWWLAARTELTDAGGVGSSPACEALGFRFVRNFVVKDGDEEHVWTLHAARTQWHRHAFDGLLWDIANDCGPRALWISESSGAVFAPYDGGVDLFLPHPSDVRRLAAQFPDWLSRHPEGL